MEPGLEVQLTAYVPAILGGPLKYYWRTHGNDYGPPKSGGIHDGDILPMARDYCWGDVTIVLNHFRGLNLLGIKEDEMLVILHFAGIRDYPSIEILEQE